MIMIHNNMYVKLCVFYQDLLLKLSCLQCLVFESCLVPCFQINIHSYVFDKIHV